MHNFKKIRIFLLIVFLWVNGFSQGLFAASDLWTSRKKNINTKNFFQTAQLLPTPANALNITPDSIDLQFIKNNNRPPQKIGNKEKLTALDSFNWNYLEVKKTFFPTGWKEKDGWVICIQDVHENVSAQKNIAAFLLSASQKVVVGVEGLRGEFNTRSYDKYHNRLFTVDFSHEMLNKSLFSATEYAAILNNKNLIFKNIEDELLYRAHIESFKTSSSHQKQTRRFVQNKKID